jgi:competence protein ComEA
MIKRLLAALLAFLAMSAFAAVDVNQASAAELDAVKGIGPAIAGRITAERAKGPFKDWPDLISRVSGIGEKSAAKLSENGLTVNGSAFSGAAPAVPSKAAAKAPTKAPAAATASATAATLPPAASAADAKTSKKEAAEAKAAAKAEAKAQAKADKEKAAADKAAAAKDKKAEKAAAAASAAKN